MRQSPLPVLDALESALGLRICKAAFPAIVREAESQVWTRDPFDRLIVAQAALFDASLVTKDVNYPALKGTGLVKASWVDQGKR